MKIEVAVYTTINKTFFYKCPYPVEPGMRVLIPFGKQKLIGVVLQKNIKVDESLKSKLKNVYQVLDNNIVFTENMIKLAKWISLYYLHPIGEVFKTMYPTTLTIKSDKIYILQTQGEQHIINFDDKYASILKYIFKFKKQLHEYTFLKRLNQYLHQQTTKIKLQTNTIHTLIRTLINKNYIKVDTNIIADKNSNQHISSHEEQSINLLTKKIQQIISHIQQHKQVCLTEKQQLIVNTIITSILNKPADQLSPFLLHGITGSGKTEIYLHLIEMLFKAFLSQNHKHLMPQVLVMVPEISLTPQMTSVFINRFGEDYIAVVHSGMDDNTRLKNLNKVRNQEVAILIGPRSAIFAPFKNLKLIIIDEEHDSSYKQTSGLHYNARDIAVVRAKIENSCLVLASATPSIESYFNAINKKYKLLELTERVKGANLPDIKVILTKPATTKGVFLNTSDNNPMFTSSDNFIPIETDILNALIENHKKRKQSMVIINRRGYAFYLYSSKLRQAIRCPNCSISLTLHKSTQQLRCHYCEYQTNIQTLIKQYPDDKFIIVGYGSEKVEEYLKQHLPHLNIDRLDSDIMSKPKILNEILQKFQEGKTDILVGTQILAKGHDFENVTLMVLLEIDQLLDLPDFRVGEKAFQLIVQACGRAGRGKYPGIVMMQTSKVNNPIIIAALKQNYLEFFKYEINFRKCFAYPPFSKLILLEFASKRQSALNDLSKLIESWFVNLSATNPELKSYIKVLGPTTPPIEIIRGEHRKVLLLFSANQEILRKTCKIFIDFISIHLKNTIKMRIDVDPYHTL